MQSHNPDISVILPFYNAERTLKACIASILAQSLENFECILINNNSTDNSAGIAEQYCFKDKRFKLIHEKQQGVAFASTAGSKQAKASFIARMDADDIAHADRLRLQYNFLTNNPAYGAVAGLAEYLPHKENTAGFARFVQWCNQQISYSDIYSRRFVETTIINPTAMWRKSVEIKFGGYRAGDFPEDYEMWLRWLHAGVKIAKINSKVIQWRDSDERLTRTDEIYSTEAFFKIKAHYFALWYKAHNNYPNIYIWGASRISRKYLDYLIKEGVRIGAYVDTKKSRILNREVIHYKDIPEPGKAFVLVLMKHSGIREQIRQFLNKRNYVEGEHYLFFA